MAKAPAKEKSQYQKFKDAARATGCDEDEYSFEDRLRKIAKAKPPAPEKKPDPKRKAKG